MATWNTSIPKVGDQVSDDIPDIQENLDELHDIIEAITSGTLGTTEPADFKVDTLAAGLVPMNIWIPAGGMIALTTNGAIPGVYEYTTNDINLDYFAFDSTTEQYVAFNIVMPEGWNLGTIKAKFYWTGASGCSAGDTVEWEIRGSALRDDSAIDAALGTPQVITDTVLTGTSGDLHITSATPALTIGGTPALGDYIHFKVSRNVSGTDDMAEDAWLFGVMLQLTVDQTVTAW
jgi:hypothetical protein